MSQMYELAVSGTGEVRDAEGNLISTEVVESKIQVTEAQLRELGLNSEGDPA